MKIVVISDVHNRYGKLIIPECDLLISCGDYSSLGTDQEVKEFHKWLDLQNARYIISVQGNHELGVEKDFNNAKQIALEQCPEAYFIDEGLIEIEGIKIWCSAITPWFMDWAWNRHRGNDIQKHWDKIPNDIDILVTHGPPYRILDLAKRADGTWRNDNLGCQQLLNRIKNIKPFLHFFGHIHGSGGMEKHIDGTSFYNASICDETYYPSNPITIVEFDKDEN